MKISTSIDRSIVLNFVFIALTYSLGYFFNNGYFSRHIVHKDPQLFGFYYLLKV